MNAGFYFLIAYMALVSIVSVITTVYDKISARNKGRRISEATLLMLGAFGGAFAMMITMQIIRHKTRKPKFTVTLPILAALHFICLFGIDGLYPDLFPKIF